MKGRKVLRLTALVLLVGLVFCMFTAYAATEIPIPKVEKGIYVYDQDNILDDDVEASLNKLLLELEEKTTVEFAVISVPSLLNMKIADYANQLFNTLGIGNKETNNGVLLLMSRSDVKVRLEIGKGMESILTDSECSRILNKIFVPYREKDEYTKGTESTVMAVLDVLNKKYNASQAVATTSNTNNKFNPEMFFLCCLIVIAAIWLIVKVSRRSRSSSGSSYSSDDSSPTYSPYFGESSSHDSSFSSHDSSSSSYDSSFSSYDSSSSSYDSSSSSFDSSSSGDCGGFDGGGSDGGGADA